MATESSATSGSATTETVSLADEKMPLKKKFEYVSSDFGGGLVNTAVTTYFLFFMTNVLMIPAAVAGVIVFVTKVFDAVNDIAIGAMVDRTFTAQGKARPWIKRYVIPFTIVGVLMFSCPSGAGMTVKIVWSTVVYLAYTVAFTAVYLPYHAMTPLITNNSQDRNVLSVWSTLASAVASILVTSLFLPISARFSEHMGTSMAYFVTIVIYAAVGIGFWYITYFGVHEKKEYTPEEAKAEKAKMKANTSESNVLHQVRLLFTQNMPWLMTFFVALCAYLRQNINGSGATYYFVYVLGRDAEDSAMFATLGMVCMFVFMPFIPMLSKKFGNRMVVGVSSLISAALMVAGYFCYSNLVLIYILQTVSFGLIIFPAALMLTMFGDSVFYGAAKYGQKLDGLSMTAWSFTQKLGPAFGSLIITGALTFGKIDTTTTGMASSFGVATFRFTFWLIPAILMVLIAVFAFNYRLSKEKYDESVRICKEKGLI